MRILIVDDEPELVRKLQNILEKLGYTIDTAFDGEEAVERIYTDHYDLILLDIMLPKKNGFGVLLELRNEQKNTPVLMLTAKGGVDDRVKGLDLGADDYLAKPFSTDELLARIRALLRRSSGLVSPLLEISNLSLNPATREAFIDERPLALTTKEFSILEFLLYNKNRVISRFSMAEHIWGDEFDPFIMSNNIDVHIKNMRQKIGHGGDKIIRTVRGAGYMIKDEKK